MNSKPKIHSYKTLRRLAQRVRDDLNNHDFVLLYAYNRTGKTRLSMEFKEAGKRKKDADRDTLYFNAYTEDLFHWDNDLTNDTEYILQINSDSNFFNGFRELALEEKIFSYLERYAEFEFRIDYEKWTITFSRDKESHIKISRGEENIFIWCVFLAICELTIDGAQAYRWVRYFYIDDPVSSLDDNNAIAVAVDLAKLITRGEHKVRTVVSSHHSLFFNVMCNELKRQKIGRYFLHRNDANSYTLRATDDTPFFHHVATLSELQQAVTSGKLYTHHFNALRSILEKTAAFFGFEKFSECIQGLDDEVLYSRALNLLSHGDYSIYEPREMGEDNKKLFEDILSLFLKRYKFDLPNIFAEPTNKAKQS